VEVSTGFVKYNRVNDLAENPSVGDGGGGDARGRTDDTSTAGVRRFSQPACGREPGRGRPARRA